MILPNNIGPLINGNQNINYPGNMLGLPINEGLLSVLGASAISPGLLSGGLSSFTRGVNPSLLAALLGLNNGGLSNIQLGKCFNNQSLDNIILSQNNSVFCQK